MKIEEVMPKAKRWSAFRMKFFWAFLPLWLALAGCTNGIETSRRPFRLPLHVVATTGMIADMVQHIGGERVQVVCLMGPGVDPHTFKATPRAAEQMEGADILFYNGLHLEGQMGEVLQQMSKRVKTVAVAEILPAADLRPAPPGFDGIHDPHIWFDVALWSKTTAAVLDALAGLDPAGRLLYEENTRTYCIELSKLDAYVKEQAERVPKDQRVLITAHDAFYYFGRAYGFEVRSLQGVSTADEASAADREELASFIATRKIPALFVESSVPKKNLEAVQESVKAKGFKVQVGGELYSDALGSAGTPAGQYVGMVRHNIDTIVKVLVP